jgi:hypothetical protein
MWGGSRSLQLKAIQRDMFCVDKNLFGVSGQVTAPGVLVFGRIFGELRAGNERFIYTPVK